MAVPQESLHEGQALAQGTHYDVAAIFALMLGQHRHQIISDHGQLSLGIVRPQLRQFPQSSVTQAERIGQIGGTGR